MWDEKQFFKDYEKTVERIKPDEAFVEQLKNKMNPDNVVRMKKRQRIKYMAVAASILLCISIGGIGWSVFRTIVSNDEQGNVSYQGQINAGKEDKAHFGKGEEIDSVLLKVLSMIEDENNIVDNEQGNSLSPQERMQLMEMLKNAKKAENPEQLSVEHFLENGIVYYCVGEETVKITVCEEKYVIIADKVYVIGE